MMNHSFFGAMGRLVDPLKKQKPHSLTMGSDTGLYATIASKYDGAVNIEVRPLSELPQDGFSIEVSLLPWGGHGPLKKKIIFKSQFINENDRMYELVPR